LGPVLALRVSEDLIRIGRVVGAFGLDGRVKIEPETDFVERFAKGAPIIIRGREYRVQSTSWHKGQARVKLEGLDTVEEAEALQWEAASVPASRRPKLLRDEFYAADLIGLMVVTTAGREVGKVTNILPMPAQDLLQIGDILIPMVKQFVKKVDLEAGQILIEPLDGMLPGEDAEEA